MKLLEGRSSRGRRKIYKPCGINIKGYMYRFREGRGHSRVEERLLEGDDTYVRPRRMS